MIIDVWDAQLRVTVEGDPGRPPLLLLHGFPDTSDVWDAVAARLATSFHVARHDVRGAGGSRLTGAEPRFDLERLVEDIAAVADAVSPDRPVHLAGHDWGAIQGWAAVTSPRLRGRILSFTSISGPSLDGAARWSRRRLRRPTRRALAEVLGQCVHSWYIGVFLLPGGARFAGSPRVARRWLRTLRRIEGIDGTGGAALDPEAVRAGIALYRANMPPRLTRPRRLSTDLPVQVIIPRRDRYVRPAVAAGAARVVATRVDLRHVDAGHWVPVTHADVVARWIAEHAECAEAEWNGRAGPTVTEPAGV